MERKPESAGSRGKVLVPLLAAGWVAAVFGLWQQWEELRARRAETDRMAAEVARLVAGRAELEKTVRSARDENEALRLELKRANGAASHSQERVAARKPAALPSAGGEANSELLKQWLASANDPAVLRRLNLQARNKTLTRYAELFKQLGLSPEQTEQFTKLLTDKRQAAMDVAVTSFQQGEDPTKNAELYRDMIIASHEETEARILALLGDAGYARYQDFDHSVGQANVLSNLQLALGSTAEPLTVDQTAELKEVLQANNSNRITSKIISDAAGFLTPTQVRALEDLRAVQQANSQKRNQPIQALPTVSAPPQPKP